MQLFSKKSNLKKSNLTKKRSLRVEALEDRQMLSITTNLVNDTDFDYDNTYDDGGKEAAQSVLTELKAAYPSLTFNSSLDNYDGSGSPDLLVIDASKLGTVNLQTEFNSNSLVVIRADTPQFNMNTVSITGGVQHSVIVWYDVEGVNSFGMVSNGGNHFDISSNANVEFGGLGFTATTSGAGGVRVSSATATFDSVKFENINAGNANGRGGALTVVNSTVNVAASQFLGNTASNAGAVYQEGGTFRATNTLFAKNSATNTNTQQGSGGAIYVYNAPNTSTVLVNCTVADNSSSVAAIDNRGGTGSTKAISNTIFTGNTANRDVNNTSAGARTVDNCIAVSASSFVNATVTNLRDGNPNLDPATYQLTIESELAINKLTAGADFSPGGKYSKDAAGQKRVHSVAGAATPMDIGAFEYQTSATYFANDDTIDLNDYAPVFDADKGLYTFVFDANVILANDTPSGYQNITFADPRFEQSADFKTVTFTWDGTWNDTVDFVNVYKLGVAGDWSNEATITLTYPNEKLYTIVTTCEDLDFPFDPLTAETNDKGDLKLSLRQAVELANAGQITTIIFKDYLAVSNDGAGIIYLYDQGKGNGRLDIGNNYAIAGLGMDELTIDAGGYSQVFGVQGSKQASAIISGLTLTNGYVSTNGGAINASSGSSLVLNEVRITNSEAMRGGALFADTGGTLEVYNCEFDNNSAAESGGAIWVRTTNKTIISGSTFEGNEVTGVALGGGAIYLSDRSTEPLSLDNCEFINNSAVFGGAIYSYNSALDITLSEFYDNNAKNDGGAIFAKNTALVIDSSKFGNIETIDDVCTAVNGNIAIRGGAIYSFNASLDISNTDFADNTANSSGGAIWRRGNANGHATLDNVSFTSNRVLTNSYGGGGIYFSDFSTEIMSILNGSNFVENQASSGGAIYLPNGSTLVIEDATFTGNIASRQGGAIYSSNGAMIDITLSAFNGNQATGDGGAIYSSNGAIDITSSAFNGNQATGGGAIYSSNGAIDITLSAFNGNQATGDGGAINAANTNLTIATSSFGDIAIVDSGNTANRGGAIYSFNAFLDISNTDFAGNTANSSGGAIWRRGNKTAQDYSSFTDVAFTNNTALSTSYGGGAIYISDFSTETMSVSHSLFDGNTAAQGAAFYVGNGNVVLTNGWFEGNTTTKRDRGEVFCKLDPAKITLELTDSTGEVIGRETFEVAMKQYLSEAEFNDLWEGL